MKTQYEQHRPALLNEAVNGLIVDKDGIYIDATFGGGGHTKEILRRINKQGVLIVIDKDDKAIEIAFRLKNNDKRLIVRHGSFTKIREWLDILNYSGKVSGVLLDLGVSSTQLDNASRGFSFLHDGPLDMRMDGNQSINAASWLNRASENEICKVLKDYGEERFSKRIARAIAQERDVAPIITTGRLAEIVIKAHPRWKGHKHPATKVFQAIRIFINNELNELARCLEQCLAVLKIGGRLAIISFHSLEDKIIKEFMRKYRDGDIPEWLPVSDKQIVRRLSRIGKTIHPSYGEIINNSRSRSAVLRIMEKLQ
ncbi:MAG: 16S rRNA (cytosine(1402)-N(4))-methyltransferase RsmH [Coxiellaceae bacterium]|jgi:16S rRNA (cytosine1402-N4)-methyltransferase|nr:16S rRNA (cytosine(1402)-N(4))-methyltransferase RsmH [Coxiellaceae bacterium]